MARWDNRAIKKNQGEKKMSKSASVLENLRAEIKSGRMSKVPSSRQLATQTQLHRHTCAKILSQLKSEGLIEVNSRSGSKVRSILRDPIDTAIDHLLNQGMGFDDVQCALLRALEKRKGISIKSPNEKLIQCELQNFDLIENGLIISDQPDSCDFLLQLSDIKEIGKTLKNQKVLGLVSGSETFKAHVIGSFSDLQSDILAVETTKSMVRSVFSLCAKVVCDYLIAPKLEQFAVEYRKETYKKVEIIPLPYLSKKSIDDLRKCLLPN